MTTPDPHPAAIDPEQILAECTMRRLRRSGPGGQHRNKVETAVQLLHKPTGVQAEANERRSQNENRQAALFRLRLELALQVRRPIATGESPSPLWQSRCHRGRINVAENHDDFPAILAEALDVIAACEGELSLAAERLGCTSSQLIKLVAKAPRAAALVDGWREARGLRRLHWR